MGQSVKGHIVLELQKLEAIGEVAHAQKITFKEEDGDASYAVQVKEAAHIFENQQTKDIQ